ncbi:hypothetical protein IKF33_00530 [Candidatus Saccharibacteria bacterium]|nr:hypothetical protein [Candidatus Saccharibacteria bacterium]
MERIKEFKEFVKKFNKRHDALSLELLRPDAESSQTRLVVHWHQGVRFDIDRTGWEILRAKVFCRTNQVLQIIPDPGNQNLEEFTATKNGKLTLIFRKDVDKISDTEFGKFIAKLEQLLTETLAEYEYNG